MSVERSGRSDDGVPLSAGRGTRRRGRVRRLMMPRNSQSPQSSQLELSKLNDRLRLSLKAARDQRNDLDAVPFKVAGVIENLVDLAAAAQGEAFRQLRVACHVPKRRLVKGREATSAADRAAYRAAHSNLLDEAETLMKELRSQYFSPDTLRAVFGARPSPGDEGAVHSGEKAVALGFEIASYLTLRDSEGVARKGLSVAARHAGKEIQAAVKVGQYLMGPSPLTLANDVTEVVGEAVAGINKRRLQRCVVRVSEAIGSVEALEASRTPEISSPLTDSPRHLTVDEPMRSYDVDTPMERQPEIPLDTSLDVEGPEPPSLSLF
ncbi:hypothetical protein ACIGDI_12945 [Streptomyces sp. NPDC085900]|uniref:hypothetical protein n=1 Tax=Streptomyces sp. NPDC085900 TaxID=3365737 RepID=UPI0037D30C32